MKNKLQAWLEFWHLDETKILNCLQNAGIISDHAVTVGQVASADCQAAIDYLCQNYACPQESFQ